MTEALRPQIFVDFDSNRWGSFQVLKTIILTIPVIKRLSYSVAFTSQVTNQQYTYIAGITVEVFTECFQFMGYYDKNYEK